jgi:FkbM family methyltransferase
MSKNEIRNDATGESYRQIFGVGATVFDIGSYNGDVTYTYLNVGAGAVIAVEPQPVEANNIREKYKGDERVTVVECAVSSKNGEGLLYMCQCSTLSSLNAKWKSGRFRNHTWDKSIKVKTVTLDSLILEYGLPAFIKIDTEGGEIGVLSGLSVPVDAMSFEFVSEFVDDAARCIDLISLLGNYSFNYSVGNPTFLRFQSQDWLDKSGLFRLLRSRISGNADMWGDIYAKREKTDEQE